MELEGKIVAVLEMQSGTTARGEWKKQNCVIETIADYPKKVCLTVWGDKVNTLATLKTGDMVSVSVDLESREFNGKWYTDVKANRIDALTTFAQSKTDEPPMPSQSDFDSIYSSEEDIIF